MERYKLCSVINKDSERLKPSSHEIWVQSYQSFIPGNVGTRRQI